MWDVLYRYYQNVAKPYKDKSDAWLYMAADASYYGQACFEAEKLAFLLDLGEHQVYPNQGEKLISLLQNMPAHNNWRQQPYLTKRLICLYMA